MASPRAIAVLCACIAACSSNEIAAPAVDAGSDVASDAPVVTDPFCRGRPLLPFCEDFDDRALPGAFAEIAGGVPIDVRVIEDATASSPPKVLVLSKPDGAAGASVWLRTPPAPRSPKANTFFRIRIDTLSDETAVAAFTEAGGHRMTMIVAADGTVGLRESGATVDGGGPVQRMSAVKIERGVWTSVRWDIRFFEGVARTRLRLGSQTAHDGEPIALAGNDAAARIEIGLEPAAASPGAAAVAFDSVTFEPNAE